MRLVTFTLYADVKSTSGKVLERSWGEWIEVLTQHRVRGDGVDEASKEALDRAKDGPAIVLGEVSGGRSNANVRSVHALSLDLDDLDHETLKRVLMVDLLPYEYVAYTTYKSGAAAVAGRTRARVILPLDLPLDPSVHRAAWEGLNELVRGVNDPSTKDPARLNLLPSTFDPTRAWAHHHRGRWLPVSELPVPGVNTEEAKKAIDIEGVRKARHRLRSLSLADALKEAAAALAKGDSFAGPGKRHTTMRDLTWHLAVTNPDLSEAQVAELFAPSLVTMSLAPGAPTTEQVLTAWRGARAKVQLDQAAYKAKKEAEAEAEKEEKGRKRQLAMGGNSHLGPYTEDEFRDIAKVQGCTVEELKQRWIVQRGGRFWFLGPDGHYHGYYGEKDAAVASFDWLTRSPARLTNETKTSYSYRTISDLSRENGTVAERVLIDMTIENNLFEIETRTMRAAGPRIRRDLESCPHDIVAQWLRLLGGEYYETLCDWLACLPDLERMVCAIYFAGAPGSGKTTFAEGCAHLWTTGAPTPLADAISDFNGDILRCPVVVADEKLPVKFQMQVTSELRKMIGTSTRTIRQKYMDPIEIEGALRVLLTANNPHLLDASDMTSREDLEAVAQRFLYLEAPYAAAEFMKKTDPDTRDMMRTKWIAEHALYLHETRKVDRGDKRFWVEGDMTKTHRLLMTSSTWNSLVSEWLVRYLQQPEPFDNAGTGFIRRGSGRLLVNDQGLIDGWDTYLPKTRHEPETRKVGAALRAISKTGTRLRYRYKGKRFRYREIDVEHLFAWSDDHGIGDREDLVQALRGDLDTEEELAGIPAVNEGRAF